VRRIASNGRIVAALAGNVSIGEESGLDSIFRNARRNSSRATARA
jgi:hypothetical protein